MGEMIHGLRPLADKEIGEYGFDVVVGTAKTPVRKNGNGNGQPHA